MLVRLANKTRLRVPLFGTRHWAPNFNESSHKPSRFHQSLSNKVFFSTASQTDQYLTLFETKDFESSKKLLAHHQKLSDDIIQRLEELSAIDYKTPLTSSTKEDVSRIVSLINRFIDGRTNMKGRNDPSVLFASIIQANIFRRSGDLTGARGILDETEALCHKKSLNEKSLAQNLSLRVKFYQLQLLLAIEYAKIFLLENKPISAQKKLEIALEILLPEDQIQEVQLLLIILYRTLGHIFMRQNNFSKAETAFSRAIQIQSENLSHKQNPEILENLLQWSGFSTELIRSEILLSKCLFSAGEFIRAREILINCSQKIQNAPGEDSLARCLSISSVASELLDQTLAANSNPEKFQIFFSDCKQLLIFALQSAKEIDEKLVSKWKISPDESSFHPTILPASAYLRLLQITIQKLIGLESERGFVIQLLYENLRIQQENRGFYRSSSAQILSQVSLLIYLLIKSSRISEAMQVGSSHKYLIESCTSSEHSVAFLEACAVGILGDMHKHQNDLSPVIPPLKRIPLSDHIQIVEKFRLGAEYLEPAMEHYSQHNHPISEAFAAFHLGCLEALQEEYSYADREFLRASKLILPSLKEYETGFSQVDFSQISLQHRMMMLDILLFRASLCRVSHEPARTYRFLLLSFQLLSVPNAPDKKSSFSNEELHRGEMALTVLQLLCDVLHELSHSVSPSDSVKYSQAYEFYRNKLRTAKLDISRLREGAIRVKSTSK